MGVSGGSKCTFRPCGNYSRTSCLSFFTFPKEEERCHRWIVASQRADLLELFCELHAKGKDITYFNRNYTLCSNHFEDHCFMNAQEKKRLLKDAVPTLFSLQNSSSRRFKSGRRVRRFQQLNSSSSSTSSRGSSLSRRIKQTRQDDRHQTPSSPRPLVINIPGNMSSPVIINIPGAKNSPLIINVANGEVYTSVDPRVDVDAVENSISLAHALPALTGCGPGLKAAKSHKRKKSELSVITINSPSKSYGGPMERVSSKRLKSDVSTSTFTHNKSAAVQITDRFHEYLDGTEADACTTDVKIFSSPDSRPPRLINIAAFSPMVNSPYRSLSDSTDDLYNSTMSVCSAELDDHLGFAEDEQESKFVPPNQPNEWREYRTGRLTPLGLGWDESSRPPLRGRALKLKKVRLQQRPWKQRRPLPQQELRYSPDLEDRKPVFPLDYHVKREPFLDASPPLMCLSSSSDDSNSGEDFDQSGLELTSKLRRFRTHRDIVRSSLGPVPPMGHTNKLLCGAPANSSEEVIRRMAFAPSPPRFSNHTSKYRRKTLNELRDKINSFDLELTELVNENRLLTRELYIYRSKKHLYREKLRKILRVIRAKETRRFNKDDCVLQYCRERMPLSTFKFFKCQLLSCKCPQWDFDSMQIPVIAKRCGLGVRETFYQILRMPAFRTFTNYRNILKKNPSAVEEGNLVRDDFMKKYHRKLERRRKGPRGPSRRKTCKSISSAIKDYLQKNEEEVAYEQ